MQRCAGREKDGSQCKSRQPRPHCERHRSQNRRGVSPEDVRTYGEDREMDVFAVRLPRELKAALQSRARAEDREMGQLVREALAAYLGG